MCMRCARGVRQLDSQVKGDKVVRGMKGMRGEGSVIMPHTCMRIPHTCVSTHLGLESGLAR